MSVHHPWPVAKAVVAVAALALALAGCATPELVSGEPLGSGDRALIAAATQQALEENKVGQSTDWRNPGSGALGTVTPTRTFYTDADRPCRDYQQSATQGGTTVFAYGTACRRADGRWQPVDAPRGDLVAEGFGRPYSYRRPYRYRPYYGLYPYPYSFYYRRRYGYPYPYGYPHYGYGYPYRRGHRGGFRLHLGYAY
jgi:surface antigen